MKHILYRGDEAKGELMFFCPGCQCGHSVTTKAANDCGAQWKWNGNMDKPTFTPSLLIYADLHGGAVQCHSFVTDGMIRFLNDSSHALKGQTVPLEPF